MRDGDVLVVCMAASVVTSITDYLRISLWEQSLCVTSHAIPVMVTPSRRPAYIQVSRARGEKEEDEAEEIREQEKEEEDEEEEGQRERDYPASDAEAGEEEDADLDAMESDSVNHTANNPRGQKRRRKQREQESEKRQRGQQVEKRQRRTRAERQRPADPVLMAVFDPALPLTSAWTVGAPGRYPVPTSFFLSLSLSTTFSRFL